MTRDVFLISWQVSWRERWRKTRTKQRAHTILRLIWHSWTYCLCLVWILRHDDSELLVLFSWTRVFAQIVENTSVKIHLGYAKSIFSATDSQSASSSGLCKFFYHKSDPSITKEHIVCLNQSEAHIGTQLTNQMPRWPEMVLRVRVTASLCPDNFLLFISPAFLTFLHFLRAREV